MTKHIDLNCDMGESFGSWKMGADEAIMPYITSANIACGFHAGDPDIMQKTIECALHYGVAVGAHPGFPDLVGFGRRDMNVTPEEARNWVLYQIGALAAFARAQGATLSHVKAHGALYNRAAKDESLALAIASAVRDFDSSLVFIGLAGSELIRAGQRVGLQVANEVFADRTYQADGSLTSRQWPNAMVKDSHEAATRVVRMVYEGKIKTVEGSDLSVQADTVCIHGDTPGALEFARTIRWELEKAGIGIRSLKD